MFKTIRVKLNERVVIFKDGLPRRAYGPGRFRLWGRGLTEQRFRTEEILLKALPEVRAILPKQWYAEANLGAEQRGVIFVEGVPVLFLRPGTHRYFTVSDAVSLVVYDVRQPLPPLTDELARVIPRSEYIEVTVQAHERGLRFEQGKFVEELGPGRYVLWTFPEAKAEIRCVDMRRQTLTLAGQELMTKDKVSLRLTLTAEYAVVSPVTTALRSANASDSLYLAVQLAARSYLAGVTLDELLEGRETLSRVLESEVGSEATALGLELVQVGVKDIVLPGEMKVILNRVIEAEKEALANVILRREEVAATRSLANTARVLADNPVLLRLKEFDALKEIAAKIGEVKVVVGAEGLSALLPSELLSAKSRSAS